MRKATTFTALLLVIMMVSTIIAGCSPGNATKTTTTATANADAIEIEVVHPHTHFKEAFDAMGAAFTAKNPNIKVRFTLLKDGMETYLKTGFQSGQEGLDLYASNGNKQSYLRDYVEQGLAVALDGKIDTASYSNMAIDRGKIDGTLYMAPGAFGDVWPMYYNVEIFKKYNLKEPKSYDEMIALFDQLISLGIQPMTCSGTNVWHLGRYFWSIVTAESPEWTVEFNNQKATFDDPRFKAGAVIMREWAEKGYFGDTWSTLDMNGAYLEFTSGKAAMISVVSLSTKNVRGGDFDVSAFYFPTRDGKSVMIPTSDCYGPSCWSLYSKSKYQDAALKFIQFSLSDESNQIFSDFGINLPLKKGITSPEPIFEKCKTGDLIIPLWSDQVTFMEKEGVSGYDVLNTVEQQLLYGEIDIDQGIKMLNEALDYTKPYPFLINW